MTGPCVKRQVVCQIVTEHGDRFTGWNDCRSPQQVCPRAEGEGYQKCRTVCDQWGHAEMVALDKALRSGANLRNSMAIIRGHYYVCEQCAAALRDNGIKYIAIHVG